MQLQKELLQHRFGFARDDILLLTDETELKPTRENILTAFEEFLIKPRGEDDVIVFHFSGHGDRVLDPQPMLDAKGKPILLNSSFVTADSILNRQQKTVNDIMGKTLFLLVSVLKSEQVTVVLDGCYSGGGTRGNVRIRSRSGQTQLQLKPDPEELAYQQQWLEQLGISPQSLSQRRSKGIAKGVVIASAQASQLSSDASWQGSSADAEFSGFSAGIFTYFLTQYLWQEATSPTAAIIQVTRSLKQEQFTQEPLVDSQANKNFESLPPYFTSPSSLNSPPAEAVTTNINGSRGSIWLGGTIPSSLAAFNQGASFVAIDDPTKKEIKVLQK